MKLKTSWIPSNSTRSLALAHAVLCSVLLWTGTAQAQIFGGNICSKDIPGGSFLCGSNEVCGDFGTCVPECSIDADCPLNNQGLTFCGNGACRYVRGAGVGTAFCEGQGQGQWDAHLVDGSIACDPVPSVAEPIETRGGDNGADGVDVCDADGDGDLDVVTGWEEGGETILYLNPLRDTNGGYSPREPWIRVDARGRGGAQDNDEGKRKPAPGVEDFVFADLVNRNMTTGQGLCPPGLIPDTFISAQEAQSRKVVMRTPASNNNALEDGELWEAREFGDTEKYFMQIGVGDIDGKNCNDVVVGAKSGKAPLFGGIPNPFDDIDGGIWWFKCPAPDGDTDITATQFQNLYSANRDVLRFLLKNKSGDFNLQANGPWKRRKLADGLFFMNVVLDDVDGDGDKDVVFSDRRRVGWMINPRFASAAEPGEPARDPFVTGPDGQFKWTQIVIESDDDIVQWCVDNQLAGNPTQSPCPFVNADNRDAIPKEVFRDMAYTDLDGDGLKDIIAATNYFIEEGNVVARWYRRTGGVGLRGQDWQVYEISASGLPFGREAGINAPPVSKSVSVADIDGDGDQDLVLTVRGGGHGVYALTFLEDASNACGGPCINANGQLRGTWSMIPIAPSYPVMKYDNVVLADFDEDCDIDAVTAEEFVVDHGVGLGVPWYENPLSYPPEAHCRASLTLAAAPGTCLAEITAGLIDTGSVVDTSTFAGGSLGVRPACTGNNCSQAPFRSTVPVAVGAPSGVTLGASHSCIVERTGASPQSQCTTQVTVLDQQAPVVTCPGAQTMECTNGAATLNFAAPQVVDNCDAGLTPACNPASGSSLPVGTQAQASCNATDSSGQTGNCGFSYQVVDTKAPVLPSSLATLTMACTGPQTAVDVSAPNAADQCDGTLMAAAVGGLPTEFPVGNTVLTWRADDAAGLFDQAVQTVRITDLVEPSIDAPSPISGVECASPLGTQVNLGPALVSDICDVNPGVSNNAPALFALGTTNVTWTALDASGNSAMDAQAVQVVDTIAPMFNAPATKVVECASPSGTPTDLAIPSVIEACDAAPQISSDAPPLFGLGDNTVNWTARDASGNSSVIAQLVRVQDTIAPAISCAASQVLEPTSPDGAPAFFQTTATDICSADINFGCDADSGSIFPIGETTPVACQATDGSSNQSQCGFTIRVLSCPELAQSLQERSGSMGLNDGQVNSLVTRLDNFQSALARQSGGPACGQVKGIAKSIRGWVQAGQLSATAAESYQESLGRLSACGGC